MMIGHIIISGLFYLIPGMVETFYRYSENNGNMGLAGVFLDIKNKRDLVYVCSLSSFSLLLSPFKITRNLSFAALIFSLCLYFNSIKKWHPHIHN